MVQCRRVGSICDESVPDAFGRLVDSGLARENLDEPGNERWLLLIAFVIGLATGVHLLMILAIPAIALVIYFRRREFSTTSFVGLVLATGLVFGVVYKGVVTWLPSLAKLTGSLYTPFLVVRRAVSAYSGGQSRIAMELSARQPPACCS